MHRMTLEQLRTTHEAGGLSAAQIVGQVDPQPSYSEQPPQLTMIHQGEIKMSTLAFVLRCRAHKAGGE